MKRKNYTYTQLQLVHVTNVEHCFNNVVGKVLHRDIMSHFPPEDDRCSDDLHTVS